MKEKMYRIDNEPASSQDIIDQASLLDENYANDWLKLTSKAAQILRNHGHIVDHNPDYVEGGAS